MRLYCCSEFQPEQAARRYRRVCTSELKFIERNVIASIASSFFYIYILMSVYKVDDNTASCPGARAEVPLLPVHRQRDQLSSKPFLTEAQRLQGLHTGTGVLPCARKSGAGRVLCAMEENTKHLPGSVALGSYKAGMFWTGAAVSCFVDGWRRCRAARSGKA